MVNVFVRRFGRGIFGFETVYQKVILIPTYQASLEGMRQTSVSAYRMYQVVGKEDDAAKMAALGIDKLANLSLNENEGKGSV